MDSSISSSEIFPSHFNTYRKDRNRHGGGVFISVKDTVPSSLIEISTPIEIVWVHLHIGNGDSIVIGSFYGSPQSTDILLDDLQLSIADVKQKFPRSQIILGGDFNCPGINWQNGTLLDSYVSRYFREKLISLSQNNHLFQVVPFLTRVQNILDLGFTTHPDSILDCKPAPGLSDHDAVIIKFQAHNIYCSRNKFLERCTFITVLTGLL